MYVKLIIIIFDYPGLALMPTKLPLACLLITTNPRRP